MNYLNASVYGIDIEIRDIEEKDISSIVDYWHSSEEVFLTGIGVNMEKIVSREATANVFRRSLPGIRQENDRITLIADVKGEAIGYTNVNFNSDGDAFAHVHIINKKFRNRGITRLLIADVIKIYFDSFQLENLYFQTNTKNKQINALLKKSGFRVVHTAYEDNPDGMAAIGEYNLYEVERSLFVDR